MGRGLLRRLGLGLMLALLGASLFACGGQKAPLTPETGESAGTWAKNDAGYYFNDVGQPIMAATLKGIDVSKYQGTIDWNKAKAAGIDFAILRCGIGSEWNGEGTYTQDDDFWKTNADACTRLGIPFGTYLYSYATSEEQARSEADHVARLLGLKKPDHEGLADYTAAPYQLSYPVYYDLEDKAVTGVFPEEMASIVSAFFTQLESYGYTGREGLYASLNWVRGRFGDSGFDKWRNELWIARYSSELNYTGAYNMWQASYQEPGANYGVESETVDIDFVMEQLMFTGIKDAKGKKGVPGFTNDTYTDQLWLGQKGDKATLLTDEATVKEGGQQIFWTSSDASVAAVDKNGVVKAKGEGACTVTATLADGKKSAACTVRVGSVTVPVLATGNLRANFSGAITFADIAALKADAPDAILLDAGGSLQGSAAASLTGGVDVFSAFNSAGYDLQLLGAPDLAYGTERALSVAAGTSGPTVSANLLTDAGEPLFYRTTCWNGNRISNGMNTLLLRAGKRIGIFGLAAKENYAGAAALTEADLAKTAGEQAAALKAQNADAILCVAGPGVDAAALYDTLQSLGVTYTISADAAADDAAHAILAAGGGTDSVGKLLLNFAPDGTVSVAAAQIKADGLQNWGESGKTAWQQTKNDLDELAAGDEEVKAQTLFTLAAGGSTKRVSFGNYVAAAYAALATADAANWQGAAQGLTAPMALAGGVTELAPGGVTRGALLGALPAASRVQLVLTHGNMLSELLAAGAVQTYEDGLIQPDATDAPLLLVTDTATLAGMSDQSYTVLRDYGDAYWAVRMAISDATTAFQTDFTLPEAPKYGVGRQDLTS